MCGLSQNTHMPEGKPNSGQLPSAILFSKIAPDRVFLKIQVMLEAGALLCNILIAHTFFKKLKI